MTAPMVPALRGGREYVSLDAVDLYDHRSGGADAGAEPLVRVSQVGGGIVRRDLKKAAKRAEVLRAIPMAELIERCVSAERIFMEEDLPLGAEETGASTQSPKEYIESLSATSGLPHTLCRANMLKVASVMREMPTILRGLTRGMDPAVLDTGFGEQDGVPVWYTPNADALGAVLPSNSPGVHSLWVPAIALKTPVVLKPGREEPWTPLRVARALMAAGIPEEAFSLYPTDHDGARAVIEGCGRVLLFGDARVTDQYAGNPAVEVHGPGRSKVLLGPDESANWRDHLDVMVASVADNSGRSCINASSIFVTSHGDEIAEALAERFAAITPTDHSDDQARLAAFANPAFAQAMDAAITAGVESGGAEDVTARKRDSADRVAEHAGATYLLPTVVRCAEVTHPLANTEYMFPFTSVVEVPADQWLDVMGDSLVVTAITRDTGIVGQLLASPLVHRLNVGPLPTSRVEWDQPHEGNLFELLWTRRALQRVPQWA